MITTLFTNPLIFTYLENFRKVIVFFYFTRNMCVKKNGSLPDFKANCCLSVINKLDLVEKFLQFFNHHFQRENHNMVIGLHNCITSYQDTFTITNQSSNSCSLRKSHIFYGAFCNAGAGFNNKFCYIGIRNGQTFNV